MAPKKKVKISNVKRSQHLKNKKNYTKLKKKELLTGSNSAAAIGGKNKLKKGKGKGANDLGIGTGGPNKDSLERPKKFNKKNDQNKKKMPKQVIPPPPLPPSKGKKTNADDSDEEDEEEYTVDDMLSMIDHDDDDDDDDNDAGDGDVQTEDGDYSNKVNKKRKATTSLDEEDNSAKHFEKQHAEFTYVEESGKKKTVNLLPIKTKDGNLITRTTEVDYKSEDEDPLPEDELEDDSGNGTDDELDSDDDILKEELSNDLIDKASAKAISTADLLILREQEIARQKYRIGIICSGILEKPEDKMKNFTALYELMDEKHCEKINLVTVRKIAAISLAEVFKDILPEYRIGQVNLKMQTVRKNTMERITFENTLLQQYKKFLLKLEKMSSALSKRNVSKEHLKLAECAVVCMCELLIARPYFNFSQNICQLLVYALNSNVSAVRTITHKCFQEIFRTDKKFDLTLFIVRRLNHLIKSKSNFVHVEILTCLLSLQIKSINLDAEKESELKQKKLEAHKARLMNMSKKEKKRHKRLSQLDKELQETKAEENKQTKHYKLTEITKMMFTIYFRILKNDPNSQLLSATLEGLAEFAHVINLEFFSDLVEVLNQILEDNDELGYREQLHCVHTVFTILSGQGEVLNIDPLRFYGHLYRNMMIVNAGKNHADLLIILRTLGEVLIKRRKNLTYHRMLAFVKRIMTMSMQLLHNGTVSCLSIVKTIMQLTSTMEILLDTDASIGSGRYDPLLDDPEYCNANCTALYEVATLARHYHPIVRKMAGHIAAGVPATGEGSLNPEIGKLNHLELYEQYDSSEMAFKPSIPPPKPAPVKEAKGRHIYLNMNVDKECKDTLKSSQEYKGFIDFAADYRNAVKRIKTDKN